MNAYTDYPIIELGDLVGEEAPIRRCIITSYDGDKYCSVVIGGVQKSIKKGYLYESAGRFGKAQQIDNQLIKLLESE